jgi:transcription antitermination factor NusB
MRPRSKARELALCILYQIEISKRSSDQLLHSYLQTYPQKQEIIDFSKVLMEGVIKNLAFLDSLIKKYARNWEIERMAIIDRNILRIGIFELIFLESVPPKVSINEAIELAKKFGDTDSPRFVNGILDKIYRLESNKFSKNYQSN